MNKWQNIPAPGICRHFVRLVESDTNAGEPAALAMAACSALWPVVQPLSVTLEMAARSLAWPYIEHDIPLPTPTWHLCEVDIPAQMAVAARVQGSGHREETTADLTLTQLEQLLTRAHAQKLTEGYLPMLDALELHYTRARIFAGEADLAEVTYGPETYAIPIESRADGLWVSGPILNAMLNSPIKVIIDNNDGRLRVSVCVGWSPWVESGSQEAALLTACLQALIDQGWEE